MGYHRDDVLSTLNALSEPEFGQVLFGFPTVRPLLPAPNASLSDRAQKLIEHLEARHADDHATLVRQIRKVAPQIAERHLGPLPSSTSSVIHRPKRFPPRNLHFSGRVTELAELHRVLTSGHTAALTQAITGLGGVGKTSLALEYVHLHRDAYGVIWWFNAEDPTTLATEYAAMGRALLGREGPSDALDVDIAAARGWLASHEGWLLVFDNAESREALAPYQPHVVRGRILITSRNRGWDHLAREFRVSTMEPDEARDFLLERTGQDDADAAARLAEELGYLPLALEQAAAYIKRGLGMSLADYTKHFQRRRLTLWKKEQHPDNYHKHVATTWALTMEQIAEKSPAAVDLMRLLAFLAPDDIPLELICAGREHLAEPLATAVADELELHDMLGVLREYSLLDEGNETPFGASVATHRLVQAVVRDSLGDAALAWAELALALVLELFPIKANEVGSWPPATALLDHARTVLEHVNESNSPVACSALLHRLGSFLRSRGLYAEARVCGERESVLNRLNWGEEHPDTLRSMSNLASTLRAQGDLSGARQYQEKVLEVRRRILGEEHPDTLTSMNNLASTLRAQGDLSGARQYEEKVLEVSCRILGEKHSSTTIAQWNLLHTYLRLDSHELAAVLLQKLQWLRSAAPEDLSANQRQICDGLDSLDEP